MAVTVALFVGFAPGHLINVFS
jgi:hypothetical protein